MKKEQPHPHAPLQKEPHPLPPLQKEPHPPSPSPKARGVICWINNKEAGD